MMCSDAETIYLIDRPEEEYFGEIILDISEDDNVYFERHPGVLGFSSPKNNFELVIEGYYGKIFLPRHTTTEIQTNREVSGRIGAPIVIDSRKGMLDLSIEKGSSLELCVTTNGPLILNNSLTLPTKKIDGYIREGRNVSGLLEKYLKQQEYFIKKNIFMDIDEDIMSEYPKKPSRFCKDLCKYFNLVVIDKNEGLARIVYEANSNLEKSAACGVFRDNIKYLRRALKKAVIEERYEKAAEIKDKIRTNETLIEKFSKDTGKTSNLNNRRM
jgi:hypothetical protein